MSSRIPCTSCFRATRTDNRRLPKIIDAQACSLACVWKLGCPLCEGLACFAARRAHMHTRTNSRAFGPSPPPNHGRCNCGHCTSAGTAKCGRWQRRCAAHDGATPTPSNFAAGAVQLGALRAARSRCGKLPCTLVHPRVAGAGCWRAGHSGGGSEHLANQTASARARSAIRRGCPRGNVLRPPALCMPHGTDSVQVRSRVFKRSLPTWEGGIVLRLGRPPRQRSPAKAARERQAVRCRASAQLTANR